MKPDGLPARFYRLIYFSPRPEDDERVCVALVIRDGERTFYEFDERLRKARWLSPEYRGETLRFVLEKLRDKAGEVSSNGQVSEFSPQIQVSRPRALLKPVTGETRLLLAHRYLTPQTGHREKRQAGLTLKIDDVLQKLAVPQKMISRRASAKKLLGEDVVRRLPKDLVPRAVPCALRGAEGILLMDGVDLHAPTVDTLVEHVGRVVHTFWQYKNVRQFLTDESLGMKRVALIFDGDGAREGAELAWRRRYAEEQLQKDADEVLEPATSGGEQALRGLIRHV